MSFSIEKVVVLCLEKGLVKPQVIKVMHLSSQLCTIHECNMCGAHRSQGWGALCPHTLHNMGRCRIPVFFLGGGRVE